ncbi:hypothetical protein EES45_22915 [Streptomyces sp. ADI97-07]|uniref:hypothetical protein n=1 Tax=Streptomyces sp. ADI97-07 TaxID=1522762 RepID=UPI000F54D72D|nr:hypothetical protein [Streptomyces sp. ADI97-07]RPK76614.1 hypothetical protein EES45_22915 [Streptomyces sp. ADI97-07]
MKVTFAYPRVTADGTEHKPNSTADLDDTEAKQLIKDGFARPSDGPTRAQPKPAAAGVRAESKGSEK